jgi:hypothetical protein
MSFTADFNSANKDFSKFHTEVIRHIKGDRIIDIETNGGDLANLFDQYSGIDAIHSINGQLRTMAIRVQWGRAWDTFTIRYRRISGAPTEYQKRAEAILSDKGYLYPYLTVQAYLDKRDNAKRVVSCCIVKTSDLYRYVFLNMPYITQKTCNEGNVFLCVPFNEIINARLQNVWFGDDLVIGGGWR